MKFVSFLVKLLNNLSKDWGNNMNFYDVLQAPLLSEKSTKLKDTEGKYVFVVHKDSTKDDVKKAVEALFSVHVLKVNTSITRGKFRRRGQYQVLGSNYKKAVIKLRAGEKIAHFEDK